MSPFSSKGKKSDRVSFNLENKHFRSLHLLLYLASLVLVLVFYTLTLIIFGKNAFSYTIMVIFSVCVGIYLVFKKDSIVKQMSNELDKRKRFEIKKKDTKNLQKTLSEVGAFKHKKNIGKKNDKFKLQIRAPISERFFHFKRNLNKKKNGVEGSESNGPEYIEIKD